MILLKDKYEIVSLGKAGFNVDYYITFRLNDKCNLSCEYCRWFSGENYKDAFKSIVGIYEYSLVEMSFIQLLKYTYGRHIS